MKEVGKEKNSFCEGFMDSNMKIPTQNKIRIIMVKTWSRSKAVRKDRHAGTKQNNSLKPKNNEEDDREEK